MDPKTSRGFFNNNPGNIDRGRDIWQGEIRDAADTSLTDFQRKELTTGRFCVFASAEWGIRAIVRNLMSYQHAGWNTIGSMIDHWAPPSDNNNTEAYKQSVCNHTGLTISQPIDMMNYTIAFDMVDAIIKVECGGQPYTADQMEDGLRLAGVVKPVTVTKSATAAATTVASTTTVANVGIASVQQPLQDTLNQVAPMAGNPWADHLILYIKIALAVVTLASLGIIIWERVKREHRDQKIDPNPSFIGQ